MKLTPIRVVKTTTCNVLIALLALGQLCALTTARPDNHMECSESSEEESDNTLESSEEESDNTLESSRTVTETTVTQETVTTVDIISTVSSIIDETSSLSITAEAEMNINNGIRTGLMMNGLSNGVEMMSSQAVTGVNEVGISSHMGAGSTAMESEHFEMSQVNNIGGVMSSSELDVHTKIMQEAAVGGIADSAVQHTVIQNMATTVPTIQQSEMISESSVTEISSTSGVVGGISERKSEFIGTSQPVINSVSGADSLTSQVAFSATTAAGIEETVISESSIHKQMGQHNMFNAVPSMQQSEIITETTATKIDSTSGGFNGIPSTEADVLTMAPTGVNSNPLTSQVEVSTTTTITEGVEGVVSGSSIQQQVNQSVFNVAPIQESVTRTGSATTEISLNSEIAEETLIGGHGDVEMSAKAVNGEYTSTTQVKVSETTTAVEVTGGVTSSSIQEQGIVSSLDESDEDSLDESDEDSLDESDEDFETSTIETTLQTNSIVASSTPVLSAGRAPRPTQNTQRRVVPSRLREYQNERRSSKISDEYTRQNYRSRPNPGLYGVGLNNNLFQPISRPVTPALYPYAFNTVPQSSGYMRHWTPGLWR